MTFSKTRSSRIESGALLHVVLDAPKGNVLDSAMCAELTALFSDAARDSALKAVIVSAGGKHFSFGASVEEHQEASFEAMLRGFHDMFRGIAESALPVLVAVRGMCLGGGLELAAFAQRLSAHPDAKFAQSEITLGVFAPVASALLADRVGRGAADDLLLSGRIIATAEALQMGLVDAVSDEPEAEAIAWAKKHLLPHSASSLRFATRAARMETMERFERLISSLEKMYRDDLMSSHDAKEGIASFLEKRKPIWKNE